MQYYVKICKYAMLIRGINYILEHLVDYLICVKLKDMYPHHVIRYINSAKKFCKTTRFFGVNTAL